MINYLGLYLLIQDSRDVVLVISRWDGLCVAHDSSAWYSVEAGLDAVSNLQYIDLPLY